MAKYAASTSVGAEKSKIEIEKTLSRYGADGFMYGVKNNRAVIGFEMGGRQVRMILEMPDPNSRDFTRTETGRTRTAKAAKEAYDQAVRQKWRALSLVVKAKLEAVESGITTFEEEFLAHIVLPNGQVLGDKLIPELDAVYRTGNIPGLLPAGKDVL